MSTSGTRPPIFSCLLCKAETHLCFYIFDSDGVSSINDIIHQHFGIQVDDNDDKSTRICFKCWTITENFHNLYEIVRKTEAMLFNKQIDGSTAVYSGLTDKNTLLQPELEAVDVKSEITDIEEDDEEAMPTLSDGKAKQPPVDPLPSMDELAHFEMILQTDAEIIVKNEPVLEDDAIRITSPDDVFDAADNVGDVVDLNDARRDAVAVPHKSPAQPKRRRTKNPSDEDERIRQYFNMNCEMCIESFDTITDSIRHYKHAHNLRGFIRCCGIKFFARGYALDHLKLCHDTDGFRCETCVKSFDSQDELDSHEDACHSAATSAKVGNDSNRYFLEKHIRTAPQEAQSSSGMTDESNDIQEQDIIDDEAAVTNRTVRPKLPLTREDEENVLIKKYMSPSCDLCSDSFASTKALFHHFRRVHHQHGYIKCCTRKLNRHSLILDHARFHQDRNVFRCELCAKSYTSTVNLRAHNKLAHQK